MKYTQIQAKINIWAVLLAILLFSNVSAQTKLLKQGQITNKNFTDTIPFEFVKNKVIIPIFLHGKTRRFILDTAAPLLISKELQAECQFTLLEKEVISDINSHLDSTNYIQIPLIKIGKIAFENSVGMLADTNAGLLSCFGVEGIIGSNLLKNSILHIDYQRKELILTNQLAVLGLSAINAVNMSLDERQGSPIIEISPFPKAKEQVFIDIGDDGFYSMSFRSFQFFMEKTKLSNYVVSKAKGAGTSGLHGLEQDTSKHLLQLDSFKISDLYFSNVNAMTQPNPNSRIGAELLKYGALTLDYLHQKFYFQAFAKESTIRFQPESNANLGFSLKNEGNILKVGAVWDGSDAFYKGVKVDWIVEKIGTYEVKGKTVCELLLDLATLFDEKEEIIFVFSSQKGEQKSINIRLK